MTKPELPENQPFISFTDQTGHRTTPQKKSNTPPLLDLKVSNPIVYIKSFWKKVLGKEGIDISFKIHPLTAIAVAAIIAAGSFGLGHITFPKIVTQYIPALAPAPTPLPPDPWRETAFTGILRYNNVSKKYFLTTVSSEAIALEVPANVDLTLQSGKRIFATGKYNKETQVLRVLASSDIEILPIKITPVPTAN